MSYVNTVVVTPPFLHVLSGLTSSSCTFTFWVKALSYGAASLQTTAVYALQGSAPSPTNGLGAEDDSGVNKLSAGNVVAGPETDTPPAANFNGWQFIACVCDAAGAWTVYSGLETAAPTVLQSGTGMGIISDLYLSSPFGTGQQNSKFCAIKFWSVALTASQILKEYHQKNPSITTNLIFYLSCDSGSVIGTNQQGSGGNWAQTNSGFTTDTDTPSTFSSSGDNSLFYGGGTTS